MIVNDAEREGFAAFMLRMRSRGLGSKTLLAAMEATPRSGFLPPEFVSAAWSERMVPLPCGEAIEGCDFQALVLDALEISADHRILEIGTGSGYTAAVMRRLAHRVLTLDRFRTLVEEASARWESLGLSNIIARQADGSDGAAADGPFDRIVAWGSFSELPRKFVDQLATGGIMIAPIGPGDGEQTVAKLVKVGSRFERTDLGTVRLQALATGVAEAL